MRSPTAKEPSYHIGRFRLDDRIVGDHREGLWRAYDERLKRVVTLRLVPASDPRQAGLRAAACAAARVVDRSVARVLDVLSDGSTLVIVTEWVDGIPLEQILGSTMSTAAALAITRSVAESVAAIHEAGTAHGRLRPASVMLTQEGEVRLRGQGIDQQLWGIGPGSDPAAADLHGIGAVLMACLTTRWPGFPRTALRSVPIVGGRTATPSQLRADVPADVNDFVIRALAAVPSDQNAPTTSPFADISALLNCLATLTDAAPTPARIGSRVGMDFIPSQSALSAQAALHPTSSKPHKTAKRVVGISLGLAAAALVALAGVTLLLPTSSDSAASGLPAAGPNRHTAIQPRLAPEPFQTPAEGTLLLQTAAEFDPVKSVVRPGGYSSFAIDRDFATAWYTANSNVSKVPNGSRALLVDLGSVRGVRAVTLGLVGNDTDLIVRTATHLPRKLAGFTTFSTIAGAPSTVTIREPRPVEARYVLIQFKSVPWGDFGYRGGISEIAVRGS